MKQEIKKEIFVYLDNVDSVYRNIDESYLESPEKLKKYFGHIEDELDDNGELIVYKLVPVKIFKREITLKFI